MRLLRWGLRYKFVFTLVGFTLLVAVPLGLLLITRFADELESQVRVKWETTAKFWTFDVFGLAITPERKAGLQEACRKVMKDFSNEVIYFHLVLAGELICREQIPKLSAEAQARLVAASPGTGLQIEKVRSDTDFLNLIHSVPALRIEYSADSSGLITRKDIPTFSMLNLGISLANVQAQVRREATMIALVVGGYLILGLLIAFAFYKMILGPVESLAKALKLFKQDPSARAQVSSGDELETLAAEFNKMADAIEERKRQLEQVNAELVKANRAKADFLAVMSHELKTPLHAIRGYSQLLLEGIDGPLTQAQGEDLQNILNSGDHLLQLIDNILRFSKLEASEDRPYFEAVETANIAEEVVKSVSALAREKGLSLEWHIAPCVLIADATKLKQMLLNLLSNAIKYTSAGRVSLGGSAHEHEYVFSVFDTGTGIPEHERARIFEPFTQLDSSNTRESQGVGLGLAIVKRYIEMHGGRVWVESAVGRGSLFSIALPLEPAAIPTNEEVSHAHPDRRG